MPPAAPTPATASGACSISSSGIARSSIKKGFKRYPMRILGLKSDLLLPLDKGGRLRTWHLMRHLARRHEITYLSFADPAENTQRLAQMREVASRVETVPRTEAQKGSFQFFAGAALRLFDPLPYAVGKYR